MTAESIAILEEALRQRAPDVARRIVEAAFAAHNEAEFRRPVAEVIEDFARSVGVTPQPREEYTLIRGRADAVYARLVIEYEPPRSLRPKNTSAANQHAIKQLKDYVEDLHKVERQRIDRIAGVATDGSFYIFARYRDGSWRVDDPVPVDASSTERFLRYLLSLSTEKALTPDNLVGDFGENTAIGRLCVSTFYEMLADSPSAKAKAIFHQWRVQFAEVCGYEEGRTRVDLGRLAQNYGIRDVQPNAFRLFFAIHTYYAAFIKLLALQVAHFYLAPKLGTGLQQVAGYTPDQLLAYVRKMERGGIFRELGINNFLEGDFFGWYLDLWDEKLDRAVRRVISELANYSLVTLDVDPEQTRDLLKKLYQNVMPKHVRHNLGQYYTPDWLAERLLNQLGWEGDPNKRLLDPACGSGTFLVLAIQRVKRYAAERMMPEADLLEKILANIVGFDLDPLAVMSARTNYLLQIGDLIQHRRGEVNIPVYLCDSILAPAQAEELAAPDVNKPEPGQKQVRMIAPEERLYRFKTVLGQFAVPASLVTAQYVDQLAGLLEECVEGGLTAEEFRRRALVVFPLVEERDKQDLDALQSLYDRLLELDQAGVNGIWARIIKNAFAPLFAGRFDYVAGNPPWVNWEHLPGDYRDATFELWARYGLFPVWPKGRRLRSERAKVDLSVLMMCSSSANYLDGGGQLGFVITQSVFKSEAGRGFRRFTLPGELPFAVTHVDDMNKLQPFEGASNLTSVVITRKGTRQSYPVSYQFWRKAVRGTRLPVDLPLQDAIARTTRAQWVAEPIRTEDSTSPWITGRPRTIRAIRKAVGASPYHDTVREGANTRGANGVFWLKLLVTRPDGLVVIMNDAEAGKDRTVEANQAAIEPSLVVRLLRGEDVHRWLATPACHLLFPYDDEGRLIDQGSLSCDFPKAYRFLQYFEGFLRSRKRFRNFDPSSGVFYELYNVGPYSTAPYKVVWREQASLLTTAVIGPEGGKPVVPDHKLMLVPFDTRDEAHFLCACLSNSIARFIVKSYVIETSTSTHVLEYMLIPRFARSRSVHRKLAFLSERAHEAATAGRQDHIRGIEAQIDELAAQLWGLSPAELKQIQQSLAELAG